MFQFLNMEEWWMETISSALISAVGAFGAVLLGEFISNKKIVSKIKADFKEMYGKQDTASAEAKANKDLLSTEHKHLSERISAECDVLSKDHENLSKDHESLSKDHEGLSREHESIKDKVLSIKEMLIAEQTKEEFRFANLTDKQKDIIASVDNIKHMAEELKMQQEIISELKKTIDRLQKEKEEISAKYKEEIKKKDIEKGNTSGEYQMNI